jgi:hypothetical protein
MRAAALQYVRKVSGHRVPPAADQAAFDRAVEQVTAATRLLLHELKGRGRPRTREGEAAKGRARWEARAQRMART